MRRFSSANSPCPVCEGHDRLPRSSGLRCFGFLSDDGRFAYCTRAECAGALEPKDRTGAYAHRLEGECPCGHRHNTQEDSRVGALQPNARRVQNRHRRSSGAGRSAKTYDYRDEQGHLLFQTVRFEPKGFAQRRPRQPDDDVAALETHDIKADAEWVWSLNRLEAADGIKCKRCGSDHRAVSIRRVLYRLPELLAADPSAIVYVTEGEKDADALVALGLVATTSPMGAGKWRPEYNEFLRGRHVVVLPDNDKPGHDHAEDVIRGLHGVATTVKILALPGLQMKGDINDWLAAGGTRKQLEKLAGATPAWQPADDNAAIGGGTTRAKLRHEKKRGHEPTLAVRLVTLVGEAKAELFRTPDRQPCATVVINDHNETYLLRSRAFRNWIGRLFYQRTGKVPPAQVVQAALGVLEGQALYDGVEHPVFTRLAEHDGMIYLDLGDADWTAAAISPTGWQLILNPPVKFRRARGMLALPQPVSGASIEVLRPFVNVSDAAGFIVLVAWIVAALRPRGPYPVLALHGEQGSAKSTTARVLRALVDPNVAALRAAPREPRDLMIAATNSWCVAFDNLSHLPQWLSDALCRLSTGGGFATRELFTDNEEVLFDAMRPVLLNGIEELTTSGDLVDRAIVQELPTIAEEKRRSEDDFWHAFTEAHPQILGALLDAVAGALHDLPNTKIDRLPRMADFALWATAAEGVLNWKSGAFLAAYTANRRAANTVTLEASPVAEAVLRLVAEETSWKGTATDLLETLTNSHYASDQITREKTWPKNAKALSGALRRLAPNLRAAGLEVTFLPRTGRQRPIIITNAGNCASRPSPSSPRDDARRENEPLIGDGRCDASAGRDANHDAGVTQAAPHGEERKPATINEFDKSGDGGDEDFRDSDVEVF